MNGKKSASKVKTERVRLDKMVDKVFAARELNRSLLRPVPRIPKQDGVAGRPVFH